MKIVIVEDNQVIREELKVFLEKYDYIVTAPTNFERILEDIELEEPDLILLDINLPMYDGYHICREVRKKSEIPIIIVTSRDSEMDELMSMNLGADDFITKPYNTQILLARIASILKRTYGTSTKWQETLTYRELHLNLSNATITYNSRSLELTKNELKILVFLIKNKGMIVPREDLIDYLWSSNLFIDDNNLSVNVTRLRKKLEEVGLPESIETRRGLGYIMP
ncbi:DNA-binding response OmpR family regulator [Paenibacillus qinlingensis]|uniref:DNA-binding response OmpR family regulator n=1 Tax=Paenibacillus qinlingensis TaxID=1837343 RepID=A0ABU1NRS1_9BACL|nr:DNA-binding response OmpR family regulator [Paenibacillus qinlingensis]